MIKLLNFIKDKDGRIVIAQAPNTPLIGFIIFTALQYLWRDHESRVHHLFELLSFGFIFTWAWLEITSGVNYFRRTLGLIVLITVVWLRF